MKYPMYPIFFVCYITLVVSCPAPRGNDDKGCKVCCDCKDHYERGQRFSGIYTIKPDHLPAFKVYCDMETDGGGWTVFQRRMDGSRDFYLNWKDYDLGFGDLDGEFWLGLNKLHRLTTSSSSLRVDLEDFVGSKKYAKYSSFNIGNALTQYMLTVDGYTGNAGDSMKYHNGTMFSAKDQDNDIRNGSSCAITYKGAWWYKRCHRSNLNGRYLFGIYSSVADGVSWYHWKGFQYSLKFTEIKLRRN